MVNGVIAKLNREQLQEEIRSINKDIYKAGLRLNRCCSGNYDRNRG